MEQDSLEDFIKLGGKKEEPTKKEENIRLATTILKKKECEDRALKIVELLMEGAVRPETFLKSITYLNCMYYQDVVEERALTKICGYPLCGKKIEPTLRKRYSISTKKNEVYDLNEYGYFCSIFCYDASNHILKQIDDSPLWLREFENSVAFTLLPSNKGKSSKGIDLKSKKLKVDGDFTPVTSFANMSLDDFINYELKNTCNDGSKHFELPTVVENYKGMKNYHNLGKTKNVKSSKLETVSEVDSENKFEHMESGQTFLKVNVEMKCTEESENNVEKVIGSNEIKFEANSNETISKVPNNTYCEIYAVENKSEHLEPDSKLKEVGVEIISRTKSERNVEKVAKSNNNDILKKSKVPDKAYYKLLINEAEKCYSGLHTQISSNKTDPSNVELKKGTQKEPKSPKDLKTLNEKIKKKFSKPIIKLIDPLPLENKGSDIKKIDKEQPKLKSKVGNESELFENTLLCLKIGSQSMDGIENQLKNTFKSWITLDTLMLIHGSDRIKEILDENKLTEHFNNLKVGQLEIAQQKKYMNICKKLHLQEILEEKWDKQCTGLNKLQPLPDYSKLKEETKKLDIKVKTFLGGMLYEADDSNYPMKETKENAADEGVPAILPLIDSNSQNVMRKRVLLNSLVKIVQTHFNFIKCNNTAIISDLQELVNTFKLSAGNIVFKRAFWNYAGLICLKILALKDESLRNSLEEENALKFQHYILEKLPGKSRVTLSCLELVEDVDSFVRNHIMSSEQ